MKPIVFVLACVGFGWVSCQQGNQSPEVVSPLSPQAGTVSDATASDSASAGSPMTTIQWIDSVRTLGKIREGEKLEITYRFRNTGQQPLVIRDVRPSCGCTVAERPQEPILPGKEGIIRAAFDSKGKPGMNRKSIYVLTNTPQGTDQLLFEVDVQAKS